MKIFFTVAVLLSLVACASYTPSVPKGYTEDIATIDDSFQRQSRSKANFYYISQVGGKPIRNSLVASSKASSGRGARLITRGASRSIPVKPLSLYLVGRVYHSSPVGAMLGAGSNYTVEGEVDFTPEAGASYLVNGRLSEDYSAVWIEDVNGNIVSEVLEKKAPAYIQVQESGDQLNKKILSKEELFLNLSSGESEKLVVSKIGRPDSISKYGGNFLIEKPASVTYKYEGLGEVQFSARNSKPLFIERVIPSVTSLNDIASIKMQLSSAGVTLQSLAQGYYLRDDIKVGALDLFAEKIWVDKNTEDSYVIDALSWLCKVLAKSNNSRYRSLLQDVANEANSSKLRKYAKNSLGLLSEKEVDQFVPSSE